MNINQSHMQGNWQNKSVQKFLEESGEANPINAIKNKARDIVLRAFEKGWNGPPFEPLQIAELLGIKVMPNADIFDPRIYEEENNELKIEYNPFQKSTRINFSIAHELGHFLFSDFKESIRNRTPTPQSDEWELEFLCNIAGAEILLPYSIFSKEANAVPLNLESLMELAKKYNASLEAVFLRFTEVVDKPCAILLAHFEEDDGLLVDYMKPSNNFENISSEEISIPDNSEVYEARRPGWTSKEKSNWGVFESEMMVYAIGLPPVKRSSKNRVGILMVPKELEEDEAEFNLINFEYGDATQPKGKGNKIIVQLVNTQGALGAGFGKAMAKKWPQSKEALKTWKKEKNSFKLGGSKLTQLDDDVYVLQILAQKGIKPNTQGEIPLKYTALSQGLKALKEHAIDLNASIHMPLIGVGQAKGDWEIVEGLIHDELLNNEIPVTIYILPGNKIPKHIEPNFSTFNMESLWHQGKLF